MSFNLKSLIGKLNDTLRDTLNNAAGLCMSRTHYDIEVEHWLLKMLESGDNDTAAILKYYGADTSRLSADLQRALDNLKTGNTRPPTFSPTLVKTMSDAWTIGSLEYNAGSIRTGFMLSALIRSNELTGELRRIDPEGLRKDFYVIVAASNEVQEELTISQTPRDGTTGKEAPDGKDRALLTDGELARLARALIRELISKESSREAQLMGNETALDHGPGS